MGLLLSAIQFLNALGWMGYLATFVILTLSLRLLIQFIRGISGGK